MLFGEMWRLKQVLLPESLVEQFSEIAIKLNQPLANAISDPFFYYNLKIESIQSVEDLPGTCVEGLLDSNKNQIEIWYNRRKVQKLKINDLNNDFVLFPLFNIVEKKSEYESVKGIYYEQKEIGYIASFKLQTDSFNIDDLRFQIHNIKGYKLLEKLYYKNEELLSEKKDTLTTFQYSYEIQ